MKVEDRGFNFKIKSFQEYYISNALLFNLNFLVTLKKKREKKEKSFSIPLTICLLSIKFEGIHMYSTYNTDKLLQD